MGGTSVACADRVRMELGSVARLLRSLFHAVSKLHRLHGVAYGLCDRTRAKGRLRIPTSGEEVTSCPRGPARFATDPGRVRGKFRRRPAQSRSQAGHRRRSESATRRRTKLCEEFDHDSERAHCDERHCAARRAEPGRSHVHRRHFAGRSGAQRRGVFGQSRRRAHARG